MKLLLTILTVTLTGCGSYAAAVDRADLCHPMNEARRAELKLNCSGSSRTIYVRKGYTPNTYIILH